MNIDNCTLSPSLLYTFRLGTDINYLSFIYYIAVLVAASPELWFDEGFDVKVVEDDVYLNVVIFCSDSRPTTSHLPVDHQSLEGSLIAYVSLHWLHRRHLLFYCPLYCHLCIIIIIIITFTLIIISIFVIFHTYYYSLLSYTCHNLSYTTIIFVIIFCTYYYCCYYSLCVLVFSIFMITSLPRQSAKSKIYEH